MSEQIPERAEILSTDSKVIIALDGNRGEIIISDAAGNDILRIGERPEAELPSFPPQPPPFPKKKIRLGFSIVIRDEEGNDILRMGEKRDIRVGAPIGAPPQIVSYGSFITLKHADGQVRLNADSNGKIQLGGNGADGDLQLYKAADEPGSTIGRGPSIHLDGEAAELLMGGAEANGSITLKDTEGRNRISLAGSTANLHLGGNQADGNLFVYPEAGDNQTTGEATIRLNGRNGDIVAGGHDVNGGIVLKDTKGRNRIRLAGSTADLHLGGNEAYGNIFVYSQSGDNQTADDATIHIDGSSGDIILGNADCAEDFDALAGEQIEPGTVVVLNTEGQLQQSTHAYDKKVAGVISGAGDYRPGIVLGRQRAQSDRLPVALTGKVYCRVDTQYSPIEVGDLLTTSSTPGCAMKAVDPLRAFGAVIGKALRPLNEGIGLIPILVALQ